MAYAPKGVDASLREQAGGAARQVRKPAGAQSGLVGREQDADTTAGPGQPMGRPGPTAEWAKHHTGRKWPSVRDADDSPASSILTQSFSRLFTS